MRIADVTQRAGAHKKRKRIGRGPGSGHGKTSGRGTKGAGSRSGWSQRGLAEGGAAPLYRRLPKRGFSNVEFSVRYNVLNVGDLESRFEAGTHVTLDLLTESGLIRSGKRKLKVKVLGNGVLSKKMVVEAHKFSQSAAEKITAAGGQTRVL